MVRIATERSRAAMVGAVTLSHRLRPLGVPLPQIIAEGLNHRFPYLVLERLPGSDLSKLVESLSEPSLEAIAAEVAGAQRITANTAHAVDPAEAPYERWSRVLEHNLARSRKRIADGGVFDLSSVDAVAALVSAASAELDRLPPVPFLHDTTTKNVIFTQCLRLAGG